jgi:peptidoglycan/xylan/chitin deacetylase (PgdA/CDA1 family)
VVEDVVTKRDHIYLDTPRGRLSIDSATPGDKFRANTLIHNYLTTELPEEAQRQAIRELAASAGVDPCRPGRETLMTWDEIRKASGSLVVTIGGHTMNHYNLARLTPENALREMTDSRRVLEMELGARTAHFAYPYGYASAVGPARGGSWPQKQVLTAPSQRVTACCVPSTAIICTHCREFRSMAATSRWAMCAR